MALKEKKVEDGWVQDTTDHRTIIHLFLQDMFEFDMRVQDILNNNNGSFTEEDNSPPTQDKNRPIY